MIIVVVRHGETEENLKGVIMGHHHGVLTELGKKQAELVANRLKAEELSAIYSSDLARARVTAESIARFHPRVPLIPTSDLRERNHGALQGKFSKEVDWEGSKKELEDLQAVQDRVLRLIVSAYGKYPEGEIVFVTHGGVMRTIVAHAMDENPDQPYDTSKPGNSAVYVFSYDGKKLTMELENSLSHLEENDK